MKGNVVKHIVFDFFGTLVGYTPGHLSGEKYFNTYKFLTENGYAINYKKFSSSFSDAFGELEEKAKVTNKEFFTNNFGEVPNKIQKDFIENYITEWNRQILYYPQLKRFLDKLRGNYDLSIITNTHYKFLIYNNLRTMGISNYFNLILTSVEYGIRKPDSRIFREAIKRLSAKPETIIYVGDNYSEDYQGAISAGIRCILLDPEHKWKGIIKDRVDSLFDIERLLK